MAINDASTFDPSRRIRAALGEEYTNNLEGEAIARLSAAMASNAIRKTGDYAEEEDNEMHIKEIVSKITHTNPKPTEPAKDPIGLEGKDPSDRSAIRLSAYTTSCDSLESFTTKDPFGRGLVKSFTGINLSSDKKTKTSDVVKFALKNTSKFVVNNAMETSLKYGNTKGILACSAISVGVNLVESMFFSVNENTINELFDPNIITSAEANLIRNTIRKEKVMYAIQNSAATVIAPAAIKFGINHFFGEKIENNKLLSAVTSFGVLSEVGNVGLKLTRKAIEKKQLKNLREELNKTYDFAETDPIGGYSTIAKVATNHSINGTVCDTIPGGVLGSIVGNNSVKKFFEVQEIELPVEKAIKETKKNDSVTKEVKKPVKDETSSDKKIA